MHQNPGPSCCVIHCVLYLIGFQDVWRLYETRLAAIFFLSGGWKGVTVSSENFCPLCFVSQEVIDMMDSAGRAFRTANLRKKCVSVTVWAHQDINPSAGHLLSWAVSWNLSWENGAIIQNRSSCFYWRMKTRTSPAHLAGLCLTSCLMFSRQVTTKLRPLSLLI